MINVDDRLLREELPHIGTDAFTVLCFISSHLGKRNQAWPGMDRIREHCTTLTSSGETKLMPQKRAYNAIQKLIDRGLIQRSQHNANGEFGKVVYTVTTKYISVYAPASNFQLEAPCSQKRPNGEAPCSQKPLSGKRPHLSINKEGSINKREDAHDQEKEKQPKAKKLTSPKQPKIETDWKPAANAIVLDKDAVKQIKQDADLKPSQKVGPFAKDYFLNLKAKGEFYRLKIPQSESERWSWRAKHIAGITQWIIRENKFYPKRKEKQAEPVPPCYTNTFDYSILENRS